MGGMEGFAIKTFFFLSLVFNPDFEAKLLCAPPKRCPGAGPTICTMLTKLTKFAQPKKLTKSTMPTLLSLPAMPKTLPAMPTDLACMPTVYYKQKTTLELQLCC